MSPWKSSCLAALLGAVIAAGSFSYFHRLHVREAAGLRTANNRLSLLVGRRYHEQAVQTAPAISATVKDAASASTRVRAEDYRDEGRASPSAALQTFAWACDRGDAAMVAKMLSFEGGGRTKVAALLAGLPESSRPSWKNPEEMAAALLTEMYMSHPLPSATILERAALTTLDDDHCTLAVRGDAGTQIEFQRTESGWSYLIPEAMVDRYIARNRAKDR